MAKTNSPLCMSHLVVFVLFQLLAFYPYLITATGKKFYPEIDEPREYVIQIAIKFSDGGEVLLDRGYKVGDKKYDFYQVVPIEELLAKVNGIQGATYVPIDGKDKRIDLETKLAKGAALHFDQPIRKIRVSEEAEGGGADKAEAGHGKQIDFHIPKGAIDIKSLVTKLSHVDWRWYTTGKHEERLKHVFQSLYDGHAMVALSERVPDPNNPGEEKLEEVARFHFNTLGLNLFKKRVKDTQTGKDGVNFIIVTADGLMSEEQKEVALQRNRGLYGRFDFPKHFAPITTRRMTIEQIKEIALKKVIGGRKYGGQFRCPHFVYNLVRAIVPESRLQDLKTVAHWPENMRILDGQYKQTLGGESPFDESMRLTLENPVQEKEREIVGKHSRALDDA